MWVYHVIIILSLLWKDIICQEVAGYSIQLKDTVYVEEGLCVTVPCTFIAANRMTLKNSRGYWRIQGSSTIKKQSFHLTGNTDNGDCTLTITDARREDSGTYYFRIEDGELSHIRYNYVHSPLTVTVTDLTQKPEISIPGNIISGQEVTLTCSLPVNCSGASPIFQWRKEDQKRIWENSTTVTFTPSQSDHNKSVTCKMTIPSVRKPTQKAINLDVHYPPSITITGKNNGIIIQVKETVTVLEGNLLTLGCSVDSNPAAQVTWMKAKDVLSSVTGQGLVLSLTYITTSDADTYYCSAWNEYGRTNKSVTITVQYPPRKPDVRISSSKGRQLDPNQSVIIKKDESLTINCTVDGIPAATVSWIQGEEIYSHKVIDQRSLWSVVTIKSSGAGFYRCLAWNKVGVTEKRIQVKNKPDPLFITGEINGRIEQKMKTLAVLEGDSLILNCSIDSNPAAQVTWMKGEDNILSNMTGKRATLSLTNITTSNTDTYYCLGKTEYGTMNKSVTISVQYPPRKPEVVISTSKGRKIEADQTVVIIEDESLTLNCTVDGNPSATVSWIKENIDVDSTSMIGSGSGMSVVNITQADIYRCSAWNKHGATEKRIQVKNKQGMVSTVRDVIIGIICGISIVVATLLISKLFAKKQKPKYDPTEEPPTDDPSQFYMNVTKCQQRSEATNTSTQLGSHSVTDEQEELHYSTINFSTTPSVVSSSQPNTVYAEIKVK
ncbi:sialic acid-binding Ig-like lectin 16 [Mixophyes fleayi]|uniref:sialic acid-binding Ig-like lectin 16 n=1 Tax=Mixophyes fleayi TaxID=3061075 RepID=UPI003F4E3003